MELKKPYIICHMISTINGKIISKHWGDVYEEEKLGRLYEEYHQRLNGQAWMCGRNTMEIDFTEGKEPELIPTAATMERKLFLSEKQTEKYAIAVDPKGKLGWQESQINGDAIISLLTEQVSDEYLFFLQRKGISYIVAGKDQVDFKQAFHLLFTAFGIEKILLEGGGHINGSIYNSGLIDELSLIVIPVIDTTPNTPTAFELTQNVEQVKPALAKLKKVEQLEKGVLWLNYTC